MNSIKFYTDKGNLNIINKIGNENQICLLERVSWDDYGSKTSFNLYYYKKTEGAIKRSNIGRIKIMHKDILKTFDAMEDSFTELSSDFCSLGQDLVFYRNIFELFGQESEKVLSSLNDAATSTDIREEFQNHPVFLHSLARDIEARQSIEFASRIISNIPLELSFQFNYRTKLENADKAHDVFFNFDDKSKVPGRVIAIIGKNGTGKTQLLARLALDLSTQISKDQFKIAFTPFKPAFSRVMAVSYSVFDKFPRPSKTRNYSYFYFGLREADGFMSLPKQLEVYKDYISKIKSLDREDVWEEILTEILPETYSNAITSYFKKGSIEDYDENENSFLSSGYRMIIYMITGIVANIQENSLVIFDEPEMHLHPNAIAKLIRSIYKILKIYKSYAIIATHSPLVIQDIPANHVLVFERDGNMPLIRKLRSESFGEDINTITEDVFHTLAVKEHYKDVLDLLQKKMDYESILKLFDKGLSMNAKIYLSGLYSE